MAGMFYSLQDVCEKLGKSEDEVKQLVQEGKLREFRDGSKLLFKIPDVDALSGDGDSDEGTSVSLSIDDTGELSFAPDQPELAATGADGVDLEELMVDNTESLEELTVDDTKSPDTSDTDVIADTGTSAEIAEELSLMDLTGEEPALGMGQSGADFGELASEDTKFATGGDSINVLGGTEDGYSLTEDTSGETSLVDAGDGDLEDMPMPKLDDDVNLDSFGGSGSGLLDLSLQADDTSLGAVLDDIYPEGGGEPEAGGMGVVEEAENIFEDAEPVAVMEPRVTAAYAQPVPAGVDITFGIALFVGLIAMIYTGIIVTAAVLKGITPGIMRPVQGIIWYIMAGATVLVLIIIGIGAMTGSGPAKKSKKTAEVYQQKPEA